MDRPIYACLASAHIPPFNRGFHLKNWCRESLAVLCMCMFSLLEIPTKETSMFLRSRFIEEFENVTLGYHERPSTPARHASIFRAGLLEEPSNDHLREGAAHLGGSTA